MIKNFRAIILFLFLSACRNQDTSLSKKVEKKEDTISIKKGIMDTITVRIDSSTTIEKLSEPEVRIIKFDSLSFTNQNFIFEFYKVKNDILVKRINKNKVDTLLKNLACKGEIPKLQDFDKDGYQDLILNMEYPFVNIYLFNSETNRFDSLGFVSREKHWIDEKTFVGYNDPFKNMGSAKSKLLTLKNRKLLLKGLIEFKSMDNHWNNYLEDLDRVLIYKVADNDAESMILINEWTKSEYLEYYKLRMPKKGLHGFLDVSFMYFIDNIKEFD
jgi:hypothetical protein